MFLGVLSVLGEALGMALVETSRIRLPQGVDDSLGLLAMRGEGLYVLVETRLGWLLCLV